MLKKSMIMLALLLLGAKWANAQCDSTFNVLHLELAPDQYWYEVSWSVRIGTGEIIGVDSCVGVDSVHRYYCVPKNVCTIFQILDEYGDGMAPDGYYKLFLNDSLIFENIGGNYLFSESFTFGCPPGALCSSAFTIEEGAHTTLAGNIETWFNFVPQQNGVYQLSTCDSTNLCPTKIWVYDIPCGQLTVTEDNTGTISYNEGGCAGGVLAEANLFLEGGRTYHIRIGYTEGNCDSLPIHFTLSYGGPITGCTDSTACNYNPLATISADCIYPGDPACPLGPDLVVLQQPLVSSLQISSIVNADACFIEEGCLRGFGLRNLVRFTTHIQNHGELDYFIGQVPADINTLSDQFIYDPCHNHWHYRGYAEYVLFDQFNNTVPVGAKNGFCVLDLECNNGGAGKYTCSNMGITANCGDIYDSYLDCQWIDITGLPAGNYTLVVRVNWDKSPDQAGRVEKDYSNNWAQACFNLSYGANGGPEIEVITDCPVYIDCNGEAFGSAVLDCEGICAGPALKGDWDKNATRDMLDVETYLNQALIDSAIVTTCRELHEDGHFDVYDAALLQECVLHENDPQHWGTRFPCTFPTGSQNPGDVVFLRAGNLDTIARTFDVRIVNPSNKLMGYEFEVSGIVIDSVENLMPNYEATYLHNDHRIVALSTTESLIQKNTAPGNLVRIHYSALTGVEVCIDSIIAVVNDKYTKSNAQLSTFNCKTAVVSGSTQLEGDSFQISLVPNPATDQTTLYYNNPKSLRADIEITDMHGRVVRKYAGFRDSELPISRNGLPSGTYLIKVSNEDGTAVGRLIWK